MLDISMHQALNIWCDLEDCYNKRSTFARDTTEVYAHTLMPCHPAGPWKDDYDRASEALTILGNLFMKKRKCRILIDGEPMFTGGNVNLFFRTTRQRVELKVIRPEDYKKSKFILESLE